MPGDNHDKHAKRHDDDITVLQQQVGDVHRLQQCAIRQDLEQGHDADQSEQQAIFAQIADEVIQNAGLRRGGVCVCGFGHGLPLEWVTIEDMMRSWLASSADNSSTKAPSFIT